MTKDVANLTDEELRQELTTALRDTETTRAIARAVIHNASEVPERAVRLEALMAEWSRRGLH